MDTIRTPRLCLGDSPAACLKAARRLMREAKRAADEGDRLTAGTLEAEALSTGAYLIGGPESHAVRKAWRRGVIDRMTDAELDQLPGYDDDVQRAQKGRREAKARLNAFREENAA